MPKRTRTKAKKDKWRAKQWYKIYAPETFHKVQIGETMSSNPLELKKRITEVTLNELTGELSKTHIKIKFKINEINGNEAYTIFIGHELTSDYIRRLTRRRRSKMDGVFDVVTNDGHKIRIKPMAIAEKRIQNSQQRAIREKMGKIIESYSKTKTLFELLQDMVNGNLSTSIFRECKLIYPVKRIEIRKSEILELSTEILDKIPDDVEIADKEIVGSEISDNSEIVEGAGKETEINDNREIAFKEFTSLPGVGPSKAEALINEGYWNLDMLREAGYEKLKEIKNIGPSLAQKIHDALELPQEEIED